MKTNYIEDRKHIGTIHGLYCIDDYYQARRKYSDKTEFVLILVKNIKLYQLVILQMLKQ